MIVHLAFDLHHIVACLSGRLVAGLRGVCPRSLIDLGGGIHLEEEDPVEDPRDVEGTHCDVG